MAAKHGCTKKALQMSRELEMEKKTICELESTSSITDAVIEKVTSQNSSSTDVSWQSQDLPGYTETESTGREM